MKISIRDAYPQIFVDVWKEKVSLKQLGKLKFSPSNIGTLTNISTTEYKKQCQMLRSLWQNKTITQINHRYLASAAHISPTFQKFCCKIEIAVKIKWLFASGCD